MPPIKSNSCCCVPFCHSLKRKTPSLRFFRFPKDESRSKEWVAAVRRPDFVDKHADNLHKSYRVCSLHFLQNNYSNETEKRLKWNAVPSVFSWPKDNKSAKTKKPYTIQPMLLANKTTAPKILSIDDFIVVDLGTGITLPPAMMKNDGQMTISRPVSTNRTIYPASSINYSTLPVVPGQHPFTICTAADGGQFMVCGLNQVVPGQQQMIIDNRLFICNTNQILDNMEEVSSSGTLTKSITQSNNLKENYDRKSNESGKNSSITQQHLQSRFSKKNLSAYNSSRTRYKKKVIECLHFLRHRISKFLYTSVQMGLRHATRSCNSETAIDAYFTNPKNYARLRTSMRSPPKHLLTKLLSESPQFSNNLFSLLKKVVCNMKPHHKFCILMFDEARSDKSGGTLLLMIRGLCSDWTLPVGCIPGQTMSSSTLKGVIVEVIISLQDCGLHVTALLCRQTIRNESLFHLMGIDEANPFVEVNDQKVFGMYEAAHLLKSFLDDVRAEGQEWQAIAEFYGQDCEMPLRIAAKLTDDHVNCTIPFKKREVKYAAQVLSSTVASAIYAYFALGKFPVTVLDAVNLCSNMDRLYDSMSGVQQRISETKPLLAPCTESSAHDAFWEESLDWVRLWPCRSKGKSTRRRGWLLTISSVKNLAKSLRQSGVTSFLVGRFCLEPLRDLLRITVNSQIGIDSAFRKDATVKLMKLREMF